MLTKHSRSASWAQNEPGWCTNDAVAGRVVACVGALLERSHIFGYASGRRSLLCATDLHIIEIMVNVLDSMCSINRLGDIYNNRLRVLFVLRFAANIYIF